MAEVHAVAEGREDAIEWLRALGVIAEAPGQPRTFVQSREVSDCHRACQMTVRTWEDGVWATCPDGMCAIVRLTPEQHGQYKVVASRFFEALAEANDLELISHRQGADLPAGIHPVGVMEVGRIRVALVWFAPIHGPRATTDSKSLLLETIEVLQRAHVAVGAVLGLSSARHRLEPCRDGQRGLAILDAAEVIDPASLRLDQRRLYWAAHAGGDERAWFHDEAGIELRFWLENGYVEGSWGGVPMKDPSLNANDEACRLYLLYLAAARQSDILGWVAKSKMEWSDSGKELVRLRDYVADLEGQRVGLKGWNRVEAEWLMPTASVMIHGGDSIRLALSPERIRIDLSGDPVRLRTHEQIQTVNKKRRGATEQRAKALRRLMDEVRAKYLTAPA